MSQLLCEQVVGRGLRRTSYEVGEDGRLREEVAKVFGVPFEVIPFKQNSGGAGAVSFETLLGALHPDTSQGEAPEVPVFERHRGPGTTAEVDFWTKREVREVNRCHLNYMVADTGRWEQSAAEQLDRHPRVEAFVKNASLGFAIPYLYNGQPHEYQPDFLIRLAPGHHLILEVKGFDPLEEVKAQAAHRWVNAVNADGTWGRWDYRRAHAPGEVSKLVEECCPAPNRLTHPAP